jgi:hypothetical protein
MPKAMPAYFAWPYAEVALAAAARGAPEQQAVFRAAAELGRAVLVDPIRSMLKAPGTRRLKRKCDEPPSNFAFKLSLRRYSWGRRANSTARRGYCAAGAR